MRIYKTICLTALMCIIAQSNGMRSFVLTQSEVKHRALDKAYSEFDSLKNIDQSYNTQLSPEYRIKIADSVKLLYNDSLKNNK